MKTSTQEGVAGKDKWDGSDTPTDLDAKRGKPQDIEKIPRFDISGSAWNKRSLIWVRKESFFVRILLKRLGDLHLVPVDSLL